MAKKVGLLLVASVLVFLVALASCGDYDPAKAPVGAVVEFLNPDQTVTLQCVEVGGAARCESAGLRELELIEVLVTDGNPRTGGTTSETGAPLNDVEVIFFGEGELYLPEDDISSVPPLSQPWTMSTDERGRAEILFIWTYPTVCGEVATVELEATAGTDRAAMVIDINCEEPTEETDDDDDDSTS